jgi:pyrroline-5-carboxylate reductase
MRYQLAIIGAGVMAEAIVRGILKSGCISADRIIAADISPQRRELFQTELHVAAVEQPESAIDADCVLLSVKPYQMETILKSLAPSAKSETLFISIAAGIGTAFMEKTLGIGKPWRVIRAMPNTPMLVGEGMVAIAAGSHASPTDMQTARDLFSTSAKVIAVSDEKIDAVTAVSGSGPAYFFFLTEQMIRAGIEMGLTPEESRTLAIQTAAGAAKMMSQSDDSPEDHRKRVTTPNGTTHAAISHMENSGWAQITVDALKTAALRSKELGK